MAIISQGVSTCALCGEQLAERPYMATSGVWYEREDDLFKYCDAPMHWDCYEGWSERARFAEDYARSCSAMNDNNPYWETVYEDENLYLAVSRAGAHAWLRSTGTSVSFPAHAWPLPEGGNHPLERQALESSHLAEKFPTFQNLLDRVDWDAKFRLCESMAREVEDRQHRRQQECATVNRVAEDWAQRMNREGLACPHCGKVSNQASYHDKRPGQVSYFICPDCGRSFQP